MRNLDRWYQASFFRKARKNMSQQMHFDEEERSYQASYTPTLEEGSGSYNRGYTTMPGQKLGAPYQQDQGGRGASAGQRLALAIVSVVMLIGGLAMLTSGDTSSAMLMGFRLAGLIVVAVVIGSINAVFNRRH
jgi:hypothetical protein